MDNQRMNDNDIASADTAAENIPKGTSRAQKRQSLDAIQLVGISMMFVAFIGAAIVIYLAGAENFAACIPCDGFVREVPFEENGYGCYSLDLVRCGAEAAKNGLTVRCDMGTGVYHLFRDFGSS